MKIIGIVGSRRRDSYQDFNKVAEAFYKIYERGDAICSGLCPKGGDRFAVMLSQIEKTPTIWHKPNWEQYGHVAGIIRNTLIAQDSDVLIACVASDRKGGTEDTIKKFVKIHGDKNLIIV